MPRARRSERRALIGGALCGLVVAAAVGASGALDGCGGTPRSAAPAPAAARAALADSPPALAAIHSQADRLLGGGPAAFNARLRTLRGYPVVVNKWASWCGPCQSEFPVFQRVSVALGRRVAFLGIDGKDADAQAAAFLRRFPVSYPSYVDPREQIARALEASTYYPETLFFTAAGRMNYLHAGPYETAADLERDVRRYAIG
jgi:thiol-disulfide isomerase/thioredoxin